MRRTGIFFTAFVCIMLSAVIINANDDFNNYFLDSTLRIDTIHSGGVKSERYEITGFCVELHFAGNPDNVMQDLNLGVYQLRLVTGEGKIIYRFGFVSLFYEWLTTKDALNGGKNALQETFRVPYPKQEVYAEIYKRDDKNRLTELIFRRKIDPKAISKQCSSVVPDARVLRLKPYSDPHYSVDMLFLSEGYRAEEAPKFVADMKRYISALKQIEPFKGHIQKFNFAGVFVPSFESGTTEPTLGVSRNTAFGFRFNSLGLPRYLVEGNMKAIQNAASLVPHDQIIILVNSNRYGGGGIYNYYSVVAISNKFARYILVHEFGHAFAGLADEYYSSAVTYNDFNKKGVEPWEPNITRLLRDTRLKWHDLISISAPIPTPNTPEYSERLGAFEGAAYEAKGMFRPSNNCLMFNSKSKEFCAVCQKAIEQIIHYYSQRR